jgi:hypothetical protein
MYKVGEMSQKKKIYIYMLFLTVKLNQGLLNQLFMVGAEGMEIDVVGEDQTQCMVGFVLKLFEKHESCKLKRKRQEIL